jgi:hypothetical protein
MKSKFAICIVIYGIFLQSFALQSAELEVKKEIENQADAKVEFLFVSKDFRQPETANGHVAILYVPPHKTWTEGYIYHFNLIVPRDGRSSSNNPLNEFNYAKAIDGTYPTYATVSDPLTYFFQYPLNDQRIIKRYPLLLTAEIKQQIYLQIMSSIRQPKYVGRYYFSFKNCAYYLAKFLSESGLKIQFNQIKLMAHSQLRFSPQDLRQRLRDSMYLALPPLKQESLLYRYRKKIEEKYKLDFFSVKDKDNKYMPYTQIQKEAIVKMSISELAFLAKAIDLTDFERFNFIRKRIEYLKATEFQKIAPIDWFPFIELPIHFYQICKNKECIKRMALDFKRYYREHKYSDWIKKQRSEFRRAIQVFPSMDRQYRDFWLKAFEFSSMQID